VRIATRTVFDLYGNLIAENTKLYIGPISLCKGGPSADQSASMASMNALRDILTSNYKTAFSNQSAILKAVQGVLDPILQGGINQFGFSKPEETAMRTQVSEGTAQSYASAKKAISEQMAARGGGNTLLPSGAEESIQAGLAGEAARTESGQQLGITEAGYEKGRQNFLAATSGEMGVAQAYNPLGYANLADQAAKGSFDMSTQLYKQKQAASPWGTIGGLAGGLLGAMAGPIGSAAGQKVGSWLGGSSSGSYSGMDNPNPFGVSGNWGGFGSEDTYT
jgi:hypothetical protein